MKTKLFSMLLLMLAMWACNNEDQVMNENVIESSATPRFYGVKLPPPSDSIPTTRGVAQGQKLWNANARITIKFLDGTVEYQELVKSSAAEWQQHIGVQLVFVEPSEKADVRITFNSPTKYLTWSYTGTDCKFIRSQAEPTAAFANWQALSATERKADALRILGQVLGLEMEHRHLSVSESIDWYAIQQYWSAITDISWDEMKEYVLDPLQAENVLQTPGYDPNSIMVWPFCPFRPTIPNIDYHANNSLSDLDKEFIATLYPKGEVVDLPIVVMKGKGWYATKKISFVFKNDKELQIDWGDGFTETIVRKNSYVNSFHQYTNDGEYTIKIYGEANALTEFYCSDNQLTLLDVSGSTALTHLKCYNNQLTSLDVSHNTALSSLSCNNNQLSSLDVSHNTALTYLGCDKNQLTSLDVSHNTALTYLQCDENQLTSLDVSHNTALTHLECDKNQLTSLDVSHNTALTILGCGNNQLSSLDVSHNAALTRLDCYSNQLSSLDVSHNTALSILFCYSNQLISLDVSHNTVLTYLYCYSNQLTSLDVSHNTALSSLDCYSNQLSSLDVSHNTALFSLYCNNNQLSSLDVSHNTALTYFDCSNNQLTSLDVSHNTSLYNLSCFENPFMTDQNKVLNLVESLPNRLNSYSNGNFFVDNITSWQWLNEYLTPKNWELSKQRWISN